MSGDFRQGKITTVGRRSVTVAFTRKEACGGCVARNICQTASCTRTTAEIRVKDTSLYRCGQKVELIVPPRSKWLAVSVAYGVPLLLTLAALFIPLACGAGEDTAAFAALGTLAFYYLLLFCCRQKIADKIEIRIR